MHKKYNSLLKLLTWVKSLQEVLLEESNQQCTVFWAWCVDVVSWCNEAAPVRREYRCRPLDVCVCTVEHTGGDVRLSSGDGLLFTRREGKAVVTKPSGPDYRRLVRSSVSAAGYRSGRGFLLLLHGRTWIRTVYPGLFIRISLHGCVSGEFRRFSMWVLILERE